MAAGTMLGTAYVQIVPKAEGIKGAISNALGGEVKSAGSASGKSLGANIVSFAKKAIIAGAIGKTVKAALNEGAALQQSYLGGLDTLYGDAADKAREYARAASEAGISMNTFSEQAVSFGAALKKAYGGDAVKAAEAANTAILDMLGTSHHIQTVEPRLLNTVMGRNATIGVDGVGMQIGLIDIVSGNLRNRNFLTMLAANKGVGRVVYLLRQSRGAQR